MICSKCNTEVVDRTVDHATHCIELGEYIVRDLDVRVCDCGETKYVSYVQAKALEAVTHRLIAGLVEKLPLCSFVPYDKSKHPKHMVITTKLGKQTLIYRPSLELHTSTGDGRLNLVAELAKYNIKNTAITNRIVRQGRIEA